MENRYFQYIAGERKGEVVLFDSIEEEDGLVFVSFKDGSRCNEELIAPLNEKNVDSMLMAEVSDTKNVWKFKEEWVGRQEEKWATNKDGEKVCVQPFVKGRLKVTPIPPTPTKAKFGNIDKSIKTPEPAPSPEQQHQEKMSNDPVWVMMDKAKKFDTEVPMELTISLPAKSLYEVAKESFEDGGNKVIDYIITNLDNKKIKESLREALLVSYEGEIIKESKKSNLPIQRREQKTSQYISKEEIFPTEPYEPEIVEEPIIGEPKLKEENKIDSDEQKS